MHGDVRSNSRIHRDTHTGTVAQAVRAAEHTATHTDLRHMGMMA